MFSSSKVTPEGWVYPFATLTRLWDSKTNTPPTDHIGRFSWRLECRSCCYSVHISSKTTGSHAVLLGEGDPISTRRAQIEEGVRR
jgi:hypothetical protein